MKITETDIIVDFKAVSKDYKKKLRAPLVNVRFSRSLWPAMNKMVFRNCIGAADLPAFRDSEAYVVTILKLSVPKVADSYVCYA